jgi:CubicO group peptidase (beta-lactamase class C family)
MLDIHGGSVPTSVRDDWSMGDHFHRLGEKLVAAVAADVERGMPAAQLAVGYEGRIVWSATLGAADDATRFCLHCAGKPVIASAIWRLVGDGQLELDEPVATYIPEFATHGKDRITLRHLLLDAPGLRSQTVDEPMNQFVNIFEAQDRARLRSLFAEWRTESEPGEHLGFYQTCIAWVHAELIRVASGLDYADYIEQAVCRPLGLPRSLKIPVEDQQNIALAAEVIGPDPEGGPVRTNTALVANHPQWRALGCPAAGFFMTASELALFYQGTLHNPGQLWDPAVLKAGTTLQRNFIDERNGTPMARSLGMYLAGSRAGRRYDQGFAMGHSPEAYGVPGLHIQVGWADPATGISFAFLNSGQFTDECAARRGVGISRLASQIRPPNWAERARTTVVQAG